MNSPYKVRRDSEVERDNLTYIILEAQEVDLISFPTTQRYRQGHGGRVDTLSLCGLDEGDAAVNVFVCDDAEKDISLFNIGDEKRLLRYVVWIEKKL